MEHRRRRALVLTDEAAGHWFRRSLPPCVLAGGLSSEDVIAQDQAASHFWHLSGGDWRGFLNAYCSSVIALLIFFA